MNATPGQLGLEGGEQQDPRQVKAARALWWADARRTWGRDGQDIAKERATALWPRMMPLYMETARVALSAAGVLS